MYEVKVEGADALAGKLDTVLNQIQDTKEHKIPEEFMRWQVEDMHRKRHPHVNKSGYGRTATAETRVRHRGIDRKKRRRRPKWVKPKQYVQKYKFGLKRVRRHKPIVRLELLDKLVDRMNVVYDGVLKWPST